MNYKILWDAIGKFFYTINFSFFLSALLVWDSSLFDLAPILLSGDFSNVIFSSFYLFSILCLLFYFIIDWLDASIVSTIDSVVTLKDFTGWLIAPIFLSIILSIEIKMIPKSGYWLYFAFVLYLLGNGLILLKRDARINAEEERLFYENSKDPDNKLKYNKIRSITIFQQMLGWLFFAGAAAAFAVCIYKRIAEQSSICTYDNEYLLVLGLFFIAIITNTFLKFFRFKYVNSLFYEHKKMKEETINQESINQE